MSARGNREWICSGYGGAAKTPLQVGVTRYLLGPQQLDSVVSGDSGCGQQSSMQRAGVRPGGCREALQERKQREGVSEGAGLRQPPVYPLRKKQRLF